MLTLDNLQGAILHDITKYLLAAGLLSLMLWLLRKTMQRRRLQAHPVTGKDYRREISWSLLTATLFGCISLLCIAWFGEQGWNQLYWNLSDGSWGYTAFCLALMIVGHDAYFYWSHRLLHQRRLMRFAHRVHHQSHTPTPWAAYAFHPLEALTQILYPVVFAMLLPMHPLVIWLWSLHMIVRNVIGHAGYELMPRWMVRSGWFDWLTTSTHHDLHHQYGRHNFGLYFTWWDRWMGTEHPDYAVRVASNLGLPAPSSNAITESNTGTQ